MHFRGRKALIWLASGRIVTASVILTQVAD